MVIQFVIIGMVGIILGIGQFIWFIKSKNPNRFAGLAFLYKREKYDLIKVSKAISMQIIVFGLLIMIYGLVCDDVMQLLDWAPVLVISLIPLLALYDAVIRLHKYFRIK